MMLPRTLNGIAWAKIGGCAAGWWPSLMMIALGGLLVPNVISSMLEGIFDPDIFFFIAYFAMQIVVFLELTVLTSISLTWAAWPLAAPLSFFAIFVANGVLLTCLVSSFAASGSGIQVVFFLLTGVSVVVAAILYQRIGAAGCSVRLRTAHRTAGLPLPPAIPFLSTVLFHETLVHRHRLVACHLGCLGRRS